MGTINWDTLQGPTWQETMLTAATVADVENSAGPPTGPVTVYVFERFAAYLFTQGDTTPRNGTSVLGTNGQGSAGRWNVIGASSGSFGTINDGNVQVPSPVGLRGLQTIFPIANAANAASAWGFSTPYVSGPYTPAPDSFTANDNTRATGQASCAFNESTIAAGNYSAAFGGSTIVQSTGPEGFTCGDSTRVHAEGGFASGIGDQYFTVTGAGPAIALVEPAAIDDTMINIQLRVSLAGARGVAKIQVSFDNAVTWSGDILTAATVTLVAGVDATIAVGNFLLTDTYLNPLQGRSGGRASATFGSHCTSLANSGMAMGANNFVAKAATAGFCSGTNGTVSGSAGFHIGSGNNVGATLSVAAGTASATAAVADGSWAVGYTVLTDDVYTFAWGVRARGYFPYETVEATGCFSVPGDGQARRLILRGTTPGNAPAESTILKGGIAASMPATATQTIRVRTDCAYVITYQVIGASAAENANPQITGCFNRYALVDVKDDGTVTIVEETIGTDKTHGASFVGATVALVAPGGAPSGTPLAVDLNLTCTLAGGITKKTRWVAIVQMAEVYDWT